MELENIPVLVNLIFSYLPIKDIFRAFVSLQEVGNEFSKCSSQLVEANKSSLDLICQVGWDEQWIAEIPKIFSHALPRLAIYKSHFVNLEGLLKSKGLLEEDSLLLWKLWRQLIFDDDPFKMLKYTMDWWDEKRNFLGAHNRPWPKLNKLHPWRNDSKTLSSEMHYSRLICDQVIFPALVIMLSDTFYSQSKKWKEDRKLRKNVFLFAEEFATWKAVLSGKKLYFLDGTEYCFNYKHNLLIPQLIDFPTFLEKDGYFSTKPEISFFVTSFSRNYL